MTSCLCEHDTSPRVASASTADVWSYTYAATTTRHRSSEHAAIPLATTLVAESAQQIPITPAHIGILVVRLINSHRG